MLGLTQALESYRKDFRFFVSLILPLGFLYMFFQYGFMLYPIDNGNWIRLLPFFAYIIFYTVLIGASFYAVSEKEKQRQPGIRESLIFGLKQGWKTILLLAFLAVTSFLPYYTPQLRLQTATLIRLIYYFLLIVLVLRYILVLPVWLLEERSMIDSFHHAVTLEKGRRTGLLVEYLALLVMIRVGSFMLQMLLFSSVSALIQETPVWFMGFYRAMIDPLLNTLLILWIYHAYRRCTELYETETAASSV